MRTPILLLAAVVFTIAGPPALGQTDVKSSPADNQTLKLTDTLRISPDLTSGKLANGITYYIRENHKPEKRAELRVAVNAGSVLEDDDQQGLAHFVEHMAFNGTKNFAKQELVNYLEDIGTRFGPDLNAYTSFDETVYMLQVPTDSTELVETAFQILEDWAHQVSFEDEEIDKERGVIVEEWRLGRGAWARMRDKQYPILFQGSRYGERLPIGKKEIVENAPYDALRRFYHDWYRPDLMAVIAIGDFDKVWIENLIKEHFSTIPSVPEAKKRELYPVPGHEETLFAIATDPEATDTRVNVYYKEPLHTTITVADYRDEIVAALYNGMFNQRLYELTRLPDPPFVRGYSIHGRLVRSSDVYRLGAIVQDGGVERGLEALLLEAARVKRYGFTASELEREKKEALRRMERLYNERDKTDSRGYASECVRHFLSHEPAPGVEYEYELYKRYLPTITLDEINQLADRWITDENRVIMVGAPEKPDIPVPDENDLLAVFDGVEMQDIAPYLDDIADRKLIDSPPTPSEIVDEQFIEPLGLTQWTLANGVRVIVKPTDFKNDEILFYAYSPGGNSLVPDADYISALVAPSIVREGRLGTFSMIEIEKLLAGHLVNVGPWISSLYEGFSGNCAPEDLETMFQLIQLYFTGPHQDSTTYLAYRTRLRSQLENRSASPEAVFMDTLRVTLAQHHLRARPWSVDMLDGINLQTSYDIFRDRFADAGDFTFILVGNCQPADVRPLVETYLGGLPSIKRTESWRDVGITPPEGVVAREVDQGLEQKSRVRIVYTGDFEWNRQNLYDLDAMIAAFRIKLREILREDLGGTYGVRVNADPTQYPREEYSITIGFGCNPERVQELKTAVYTQIDSLREHGLDDSYIRKVREMQRRQREKDLKENRFWLNALRTSYMSGENPLLILEYDDLVETLSTAAVQNAARKYFNTGNYVELVLMPEKSP